MTTATDWAWLAGLIDADGTITLEADGAPRVQVAMASVATIERVAELMREATGRDPYRWHRATPAHHADSYYVRTTTQAGVADLLIHVLPYLVTKQQVAQVVERRCGTRDRASIDIARHEVAALNRRGGSVHHSAPYPDDPVSRIVWLPHELLHGNSWNPNRVHKPELKLLRESMLLTRWVQPVLATADGMIVDGFHRWSLVARDREVGALTDGHVPTAVLDIDRPSAMLLTVRINRAKGSHAATLMSELVRALLAEGVERDRIAREMGATTAEVDLLAQPDVFRARSVATHAYSPSWYPVEVTEAEAAERKAARGSTQQ